ncbi:MAG: NAD-dependent deacetylase [Acidimicrobiia bacterium]|nr:NAD-dependent deacetylase [Acidimicrobiia bacterium]
MATLTAVTRWIDDAGPRSITVLTGAGISTDSGIPDFRGPNGVWTKNPGAEKASNLQNYLGDPDLRRRSWQARVGSPAWSAQPNAGHLALLELERSGRLHTLVTQNTDGLHLAAGHDPERVVEIHGNARRVVCWDCGDKAPMEKALARVRAGEADPPCRSCGGILKSDAILFGQDLVRADLQRAEEAAAQCELLLAVGTTLGVYPAAGMLPIAKSAGARIVILNGEPTQLDHLADMVLRAPIGDVLPALLGDRVVDPHESRPDR